MPQTTITLDGEQHDISDLFKAVLNRLDTLEEAIADIDEETDARITTIEDAVFEPNSDDDIAEEDNSFIED